MTDPLAIEDPNTGLIYVFGGCKAGKGTATQDHVGKFNPSTGLIDDAYQNTVALSVPR